MISPAKFYPEFDGAQVEETITPLARYDGDVTALLSRPGPVDGTPPPSGEVLTTARVWAGQPERYPFQRLVRDAATGIVDSDPLHGHRDLFDDPEEALVQLLERTEARLGSFHARPLVAALNRARVRGVLVGDTPAERYTDFVERSLRSSVQEVSGLELPVLTDVTRLVLRNAAESTREACARLAADRDQIADVFGIAADDRLVSLGSSDGDTHHHGRSVSVLTFRSGRRLVHKPRDVSCESAYRTVAEVFNTRLGTSLPCARVLERDGYGYVEHVESEDVSDMIPGFMRASGELAAVLYLFDARDMHFENVLPTRRGPLPIDLETLFHQARVYTGPVPETPGNAHSVISRSVYGTGLLPLVMSGRDPESGHVDFGFLGGQGSGVAPFRSMLFERPFTDEMRLVLRSGTQEERSSVVGTLSPEETQDIGEEMAEGFTRVYRAVAADPGPWADLLRRVAARVRVRYVHNPTALYGQALRMTAGANPMDDREVYTALLKRIAIPSRSAGHEIVRSEIRQLAERDVPYFTTAATGTALDDGDGNPVGVEFAQTPLERALDKLRGMGEKDLALQRTLIHSAFASRFPDNHLLPASAGTGGPGGRSRPRGRTGPAELAGRIADRLVETSLPDRFTYLPPTWIGPRVSAAAHRPWPPGVLGLDLYTGRTGPALALAASARVLGRADHGELAERVFSATAELVRTIPRDSRDMDAFGWSGYTGSASLLFGLCAAGRLMERPDWVEAARDAVPLVTERIAPLPSEGTALDVVDGLAGVLLCLSAVGGPAAEAATASLTDRLLTALADGGRHPVLNQSGFAHGVSGLIHTLVRVGPLLPEDRRPAVTRTLHGLVDGLGRFHVPEEDNWFSNTATPRSFSSGWCHGSAGIALALNSFHGLTGDPGVLRLRDTAVRTTLRNGFGRNLTWCHGDLGNHAILTEISRGAGGEWLLPEIAAAEERWLNAEVIERKNADTRSRYAHTSSLMVGTAGILLHLLRRVDPALALSLVTLTPGGESAT
ncbi:type 2 lanthipeptide synthetase LanM family protein [Nocardiopsis alborubida]|uniref:Type 2 lantipeptide synthetase LanM n=1 Tax=Nocardiopsis alborubida TaxID=146802 RepID=A0A7X6MHB0_9ACTN|nr:type 2 lanthipeptide synthetase LanM family protein [Nocardiopsis alborubida]NKZ01597.1 type 2 lantipeptide synthetase LanM [Nocardiopsis alborubida]